MNTPTVLSCASARTSAHAGDTRRIALALLRVLAVLSRLCNTVTLPVEKHLTFRTGTSRLAATALRTNTDAALTAWIPNTLPIEPTVLPNWYSREALSFHLNFVLETQLLSSTLPTLRYRTCRTHTEVIVTDWATQTDCCINTVLAYLNALVAPSIQ